MPLVRLYFATEHCYLVITAPEDKCYSSQSQQQNPLSSKNCTEYYTRLRLPDLLNRDAESRINK